MVERDLQLAAEVAGPRQAEFAASRARLGINREQTWLQETPMGTFAAVTMEADDIPPVMAGLSSSQDPLDEWFRDEVLAIHGLDLTHPPPGPPNELIISFQIE